MSIFHHRRTDLPAQYSVGRFFYPKSNLSTSSYAWYISEHMNQESVEETKKETTSTPTNASLAPRIILMYVLGVALIVGIALFIYNKLSQDQPQTYTDEEAVTTLSVPGSGPVAMVNGVEIERTTYQERLDNITGTLSAQGINFTSDEIASSIRTQALNELINYQLLVQASSDQVVSDEEIETAKTQIIANVGGEEALQALLNEQGLSEEDLTTEIKERLRVDSYIDEVTDLEQVSLNEGEVEAYYQKVTDGLSEVPDLAEVRDQLTLQLIQEKQQALVEALVAELRNEATIEVLI